MTCPDCTSAAQELWHGFRSGCKGCQARAVSRCMEFFTSRQDGKQTWNYRRLLDGYGLTNSQVLEAAKHDAINKDRDG